MTGLLADPLFWTAAVAAILIAGISKGGFAGGLVMLGVPTLSLVVPPQQAAALMLPALCVMDITGLIGYWGKGSRANLIILITGAAVGIAIGVLVFRWLDADAMRLLIGTIAVGFALNHWLRRAARERPATRPSWRGGGFWGAVGGFVSFVAHAGGPPVYVYLLPQKLDKTTYQATTVFLFAAINYLKLGPYWWLGQFEGETLWTGLALCPLAVAGMWVGIKLHHKVSDRSFFRIAYVVLFLVGSKLIWDGISGLSA